MASGTNLALNLESPTSIAPGTLITLFGTNLCNTTAIADLTQQFLPFTLGNCQLFVDGVLAPLTYVSATQFNAQMPLYVTDRSSVSAYIRMINPDGSATVTAPIAVTVVPQNPGIFAQDGTDPRPGIVYHGSSSANDIISVNGSINAGDVATVSIGSAVYTYTILATDSLASVQTAIINLINNAPDPNVYATAANEFNNIVLTSRIPGPAGDGISVTVSVTGTSAALVLTADNATLCCDNIQGALVTTENPAVPGEFVYLFATGLGPTNPLDQSTGQIFQGGTANPPAIPVDSVLTGSFAANIVSTALVPGTVGVYYVLFQISASATTDPLSQTTIAQQAFVSNVITMPILQPGVPFVTDSVSRNPALRRRAPTMPRR